MKLENTMQELVQTSPAHSVLFITRFKRDTTIYEAYLIETPIDQAPSMNTEPMTAGMLRINWASTVMEGWDSKRLKTLANLCISNEAEHIGYLEERVS